MANRRFNQFIYSFHGKPVRLDLDIPIGATGAVGTVAGAGISAVTRLAAGIYKVKFQDNYNKFLGMSADIWSPNTGSNIAATALTPGLVYTITALGTTTTAGWVTAGVPAGITPAIGVSFLCAATSSGNGTAKVQGVSSIAAVEIIGLPNTTISNTGLGNSGGYVILQTLAATDSSTTTMIATDPANGSLLSLEFYLSDSSNSIPDLG